MLKSLRRGTSGSLELEWKDGHSGPVSLAQLRDACPCAGCQGETVLLHSYPPNRSDHATEGRNELRGADTVGSYAIQFFWGDGHKEGIYTWEHLRSLCECDECMAARAERAGGLAE